MVRPPAVAGRFYPQADPELERIKWRRIAARSCRRTRAANAIACMVPHAGYRYSGQVAGAVYARLELPRHFLLLGPAALSTRRGRRPFSPKDPGRRRWAVRRSIRNWPGAEAGLPCAWCEDEVAHRESTPRSAVAVSAVPGRRFSLCADRAGHPGLSRRWSRWDKPSPRVLARQTEPVLMIASSDMNHYESDEITRRKDRSRSNGCWRSIRAASTTWCVARGSPCAAWGAAVSVLDGGAPAGRRREPSWFATPRRET